MQGKGAEGPGLKRSRKERWRSCGGAREGHRIKVSGISPGKVFCATIENDMRTGRGLGRQDG
jgi:hypothetical protein